MAATHLRDSVVCLGARSDTAEIQRASDVAVLCSRPAAETFPVSLAEALASGVPLVSTDVGSIRELVRKGETGFLAPPGDEQALGATLGRLLEDAALRARRGATARADVLQRFRREEMIAACERLFLEVATA